MQFVQNLNNLILDDQYFLDVPVPEGTASAPTGNIGIVGTFNRGPLNTPVLVNNYPDMVRKFGDVIAVAGNPLTDVTEMERVKFVMKGGVVVKNDLAPRPPSTAAQ